MKYAVDKIKEQIIDLVLQAIDEEVEKEHIEVTSPPMADMGDFAVPCFYFAKLLGRAPNAIAEELSQKIASGGIIKQVKNVGPYLNFFINVEVFSQRVLKEVVNKKDSYGELKLDNEKAMLEFSQPNTHKEFHIGHLRNAVLGDSLVKILKSTGKQMIPVNYIGDIGSHVAKCLWALEKYHQDDELPENKGRYLGEIYSEASQKTEANENFKKDAANVQKQLEDGDKKLTALWKKTRQWSLDSFDKIYKTLGIEFDHVFYESDVEKPGKKIVEDLLKKGLAEKSEGAVIINLEKYDLKNFLLLKSDGSSLYSTKEIALAELKFKKHKIDKSIVITDNRQSFYFAQVFKTLELMGFDKNMIHVPYEFVTLKEGAMASRKGNVILFEDFFKEVVTRAKTETAKRHKDWKEKKIEEVAEKIALSAIKFNMLKVGTNSVIVFDIDEALSFDGFSGPYIQYTASRINSVLKKAKARISLDVKYEKLNTDIEREIILQLGDFPEIIKRSAKELQPAEIAKYIFELAKTFSSFYQAVPILNSDPETKKARLLLIFSVRQTLINGLNLLGIEALDEM